MRDLVIKTILGYYGQGITDLNLKYIQFARTEKLPHIDKYEWADEIPLSEIKEIINLLTNEELLKVLDIQARDAYR